MKLPLRSFFVSEGRVFEPESLAPQITIRNAFNSVRVPNHILLTLFDYSSLPFRVQCGRSTRCCAVRALQRASF
jgi:hypothetical protein